MSCSSRGSQAIAASGRSAAIDDSAWIEDEQAPDEVDSCARCWATSARTGLPARRAGQTDHPLVLARHGDEQPLQQQRMSLGPPDPRGVLNTSRRQKRLSRNARVRDHGFQIPVAAITSHLPWTEALAAPDPASELALLQHPQQLDLHRQRITPIVEGSLPASSKRPCRAGNGTVASRRDRRTKCPPSEQLHGNGAAVDGHI